ncbi:hypothetical protein PBI_VALIDUS_100 [Mycobacterium phage Validus]|uniref:Uncharacterized protein n=1 Tax=Mycobacterium phage Validus TaxID=1414747 RepID=V5UQF7_9CAUD|nr:hypothetical protein CC50_gp011 [Mycobacterium phage Validus]AHB79630.1 hypothetical protein PBI_VALIDUS_100 [Mycobacterium phage Validus]
MPPSPRWQPVQRIKITGAVGAPEGHDYLGGAAACMPARQLAQTIPVLTRIQLAGYCLHTNSAPAPRD